MAENPVIQPQQRGGELVLFGDILVPPPSELAPDFGIDNVKRSLHDGVVGMTDIHRRERQSVDESGECDGDVVLRPSRVKLDERCGGAFASSWRAEECRSAKSLPYVGKVDEMLQHLEGGQNRNRVGRRRVGDRGAGVEDGKCEFEKDVVWGKPDRAE
jgi:hypothetical protein